jgi:hypothetical protein
MFATANPFLGGFVVRGLRSDGTRKSEKPIRKPGKQEKNYLGSGLKAWPSLGIRCSLINSLLSGFRIRTREGTKCQRLHELSLRDRRRVTAFASGSWGGITGEDLNRSRTSND